MWITRKYEFDNEAQADSLIKALPHDAQGNPIYKHNVSKLGYITKTAGEYDEEGNELVAPVVSKMFAVDVFWYGQPLSSWDAYIVWPSPMGIHTFGSSSTRDEYSTTYCQLFPDSLYCNPPEPDETI